MTTAEFRARSNVVPGGRRKNERGVALIIVLLVTALLIALIFEFAYGTRISLRAAVNFRDSQRAFFLARSGIDIFGKFKDNEQLKDMLPPPGEWGVVPIVSAGDTELRLRWEDESGKLDIHQVLIGTPAFDRLSRLFTSRVISQNTLDDMARWMQAELRTFSLLTELHTFLSDEDFRKLQDAVTVSVVPGSRININTASPDVLLSIGLDARTTADIVERRVQQPFKTDAEIAGIVGSDKPIIVGLLTYTGTVFTVSSFASVGGYTKQVEAIIARSGTAGTAGATYKILYWRAL